MKGRTVTGQDLEIEKCEDGGVVFDQQDRLLATDSSIPPLDNEDHMPLNETDKAWVRECVRDAHQRQGWGKFTGFIKDWGGFGTAVIVIGFVLSQWTAYTEFRTRTGDRLDGIDKQLEKFEVRLLELRATQSPATVLHDINGLKKNKFVNSLPALRAAVSTPPHDVEPMQPLLGGISEKLLQTNQNTPDYWPTVLQFLQFASANVSPDVPPPGRPSVSLSRVVSRRNFFSRVSVLLDGGSVSDTRFENCRIIFTENPVRMHNVTFVNSVFEFPVSRVPNPYIQRASRLLLASNLKSASIENL